LHHVAERSPHQDAGPSSRVVVDASRTGERRRAGAAVRHGVRTRDAVDLACSVLVVLCAVRCQSGSTPFGELVIHPCVTAAREPPPCVAETTQGGGFGLDPLPLGVGRRDQKLLRPIVVDNAVRRWAGHVEVDFAVGPLTLIDRRRRDTVRRGHGVDYPIGSPVFRASIEIGDQGRHRPPVGASSDIGLIQLAAAG
jgi:hypothetical protein